MNKRVNWIDTAKGAAIILVVFGHTLVPQIRENTAAAFLWIFIYNFHMPLFFFLSGWLFERGRSRHKSKSSFILGKARMLIVPYLTLSVFAYTFIALALKIAPLAGVLESGGYGATPIRDAVFQILTYSSHTDQHLWFVYSLFIVFTLNALLPEIMKSKPVIALFAAIYVSKAFVQYFGILNYTAGDLVFFSLARALFCPERENRPASAKTIIPCAAVFVVTNCVYSFYYVTGMPDGAAKIALYILRMICSVSGIFTVCEAAKLVRGRLSAFFGKLASYSYDIYLIHAPFLVSGLMGIILAYTYVPIPAAVAAVLVIGITLPLIVSKFIIRKIPPLAFLILGRRFSK